MFNTPRITKMKNQANLILKAQFLSTLSPLQRHEFLQLCHRREYRKGEVIYYQNDPGTGMYFIESGRVELIAGDGSEEQPVLKRELQAPESFGELSIGYDFRRKSSATCLTDCILLGFYKPDFETLKKRYPEIAVKFMEALSTMAMKQLELAIQKLEEVSGSSTAFSIQFSDSYKNEDHEVI